MVRAVPGDDKTVTMHIKEDEEKKRDRKINNNS